MSSKHSDLREAGSRIDNLYHRLTPMLSTDEEDVKEEHRKWMLEEARKLVTSLEKPAEVVMRHVMEGGAQRMSIRVAAQLGLFQYLDEKAPSSVTAAKLAEYCKAEELLIQRIMRVITAIGFANETEPQRYMANAVTKAAASPGLHGAIIVWHDGSAMTQMQMHKYFLRSGYKCPTDGSNCGFQFAFGTHRSYFEWIHDSRELSDAFNAAMKGIQAERSFWLDWFPADTELVRGFSGEAGKVFLVDVGGGRGHDLERLLKMFPQLQGYLVLQDLPVVVSNLPELSEGITAVAHDFFTLQPVQGAKAYYLHHILHDWPDEACRKILRNQMAAMKPGYSMILIDDAVLPDRDCPSAFAAGDLNMMSILGAMERTRQQWTELLESVGLEIVCIWESPNRNQPDGIIEAVLKE